MPHPRPIRSRAGSRRPGGALVSATGVALAVLLAGCASSEPVVSSTPAAVGGLSLPGQVCCVAPGGATVDPSSGLSTAHGGWDVAFVEWLAPHDAVASQMAQLAPDRASAQAVKDLAATIDAAQGPRYQTLSGLHAAWGLGDVSTDPSGAGHDHGGTPDGKGDVEALTPLTGTAFDQEFLTLMIAHHELTLTEAQGAIDNGESPEDVQLAQDVLAEQQAEIAQMQQLLAS